MDEYEDKVMDEEDNDSQASGFRHKYNHYNNATVYTAILSSVYFLVELAVSSSGVLYARAAREYSKVLGRRNCRRRVVFSALFLSVSLTLGGVADVNMWNSAACMRWGY